MFCEWLVLSTKKMFQAHGYGKNVGASIACLLKFWSRMLDCFLRDVFACGMYVSSTCLNMQVRCPEQHFSYILFYGKVLMNPSSAQLIVKTCSSVHSPDSFQKTKNQTRG